MASQVSTSFDDTLVLSFGGQAQRGGSGCGEQLARRQQEKVRRAVIEVERKFVLDDDANIPAFDSLAPSLRVGSVETIDLDALYYDTRDYRLARSGASLRLRLGGSDAGWHLKLPSTEPDARVEMQRPTPAISADALALEPPPVPEEFVDLTLARTGGLALQPVVRLTTRRTRTVLVGPKSQPLAEVAEDEVGAFFGGDSEAVDRWKELEVELIEGSHGELEKISRELERSGGRPADYPSKFVRAVGSAAGRPLLSEPRALKGEKDSVGRLFVKRWHDLVVELIAHDVGVRLGDGEAVHKMRVAIRRLRSTLRTFTPVLDEASARWLRDELGWLGGVLGSVRDADVLRNNLERLLDTLSPSDVLGPVRDEIGTHFADSRRLALGAALGAMRSERYLSLLDVLRGQRGPPRPGRGRAKASIRLGRGCCTESSSAYRAGSRRPHLSGEEKAGSGRCTRSVRRRKGCGTQRRPLSRSSASPPRG